MFKRLRMLRFLALWSEIEERQGTFGRREEHAHALMNPLTLHFEVFCIEFTHKTCNILESFFLDFECHASDAARRCERWLMMSNGVDNGTICLM